MSFRKYDEHKHALKSCYTIYFVVFNEHKVCAGREKNDLHVINRVLYIPVVLTRVLTPAKCKSLRTQTSRTQLAQPDHPDQTSRLHVVLKSDTKSSEFSRWLCAKSCEEMRRTGTERSAAAPAAVWSQRGSVPGLPGHLGADLHIAMSFIMKDHQPEDRHTMHPLKTFHTKTADGRTYWCSVHSSMMARLFISKTCGYKQQTETINNTETKSISRLRNRSAKQNSFCFHAPLNSEHTEVEECAEARSGEQL